MAKRGRKPKNNSEELKPLEPDSEIEQMYWENVRHDLHKVQEHNRRFESVDDPDEDAFNTFWTGGKI